MSNLVRLIDAYKDTHGGPSDASISRAIGVKPQTVSSWRNRGIKEPPDRDALRSLATLIGADYEAVVLRAALLDAGWIEESDGDGNASPTNVIDMSEAPSKVAADDLANLPSVASKRRRTEARDEG